MIQPRLVPSVTAAVLAAAAAFAANPVLRINDTQLTDVDLKLAQHAVASQMRGAPVTEQVVLKNTIDQLIGRTLLLQAARDAKVTVDPKDVAASIEAQRKQVGGPEAFAKAMADAGLNEQELTRMETDRMVMQKYVETELMSHAEVTETEAKAYFGGHPTEFQHPEQVRLRMILAKVAAGGDEKADAAAKGRAEEARKRVSGGEDFAKVAAEVSEDGSKARGGEVGWVRKGLLLPELEPAVWGLKVGEVTPALKSKFGYHVFKVEDHRQAGTLTFEEVKPTLVPYLKNKKVDDSIQLVVAERKAKAKIEALDPAVKAALEAPPAPAAPPAAAPAAPAAKPSAAPAKPTANVPKQP